MNKQQVLENIQKTQARLAAELSDKNNRFFNAADVPYVDKVEKMDLTPFIETMTKDLEESYASWPGFLKDDLSFEGRWSESFAAALKIGHAHFEWDYESTEAYAYVYASAEISQDSDGFCDDSETGDYYLDSRPGFDHALNDFLEATDFEDSSTSYLDYQITKVAEIFYRAMEKVVLTDAFKALPKADTFTFALQRHDRSPMLAYVWNAGE
jgi:hypothetical protein